MSLTEYVPGDTPKQFTASGGRRLAVLVARPLASSRSTIAKVGGICRSPRTQCSIDRR
jgi:hypothetical protein